jgi:hypothetical protein
MEEDKTTTTTTTTTIERARAKTHTTAKNHLAHMLFKNQNR